MSTGEIFPSLHGQLDVTGLAFHILDAPSWFSVRYAFICLMVEEINAFNRYQNLISAFSYFFISSIIICTLLKQCIGS